MQFFAFILDIEFNRYKTAKTMISVSRIVNFVIRSFKMAKFANRQFNITLLRHSKRIKVSHDLFWNPVAVDETLEPLLKQTEV